MSFSSTWLAKNGYKASEVIEISSADFNAIQNIPHHWNDREEY